jgi:hypothetical protein
MQKWSVQRAVLVGGSIGGLGDIIFAISFAYSNGVVPQRLLQTVASGALGKAAYDGGWGAAALGLGLHFVIAFLFAAAYVLASRAIPFLVRKPVLAGALFGFGVLFFMRLVVLPLSAFPHPVSFKPLGTSLDLLSHMFLFGVPIALAARKAASGDAT